MDLCEIEPYPLSEHNGKWAMTITLFRQDRVGIEAQAF